MLHKTKAIVLNHLKYGDTSLVVTMYTEHFGRKNFLVQGVYKKRSKFPPTFFQPFTLLNLEVYINPKRQLQRIKELSLLQPFHSLPFDTTKSAIALFLSEILYKVLKEEEANMQLFKYIFHATEVLDLKDEGIANFHLVFLTNLTKYLGFYPINNYSDSENIFDQVNGRFTKDISSHTGHPDKLTSHWIHKLLTVSFEEMEQLAMNHQTRNTLVKLLIEFYNLHLGGLSNVKSLPVLQSVFED